MKKNILFSTLAIAGFSLLSPNAAEANFVDNFDTGQQFIQLPNDFLPSPIPPRDPVSAPPVNPALGTNPITGLNDADVVGGSRAIEAELFLKPTGVNSASLTVSTGAGTLAISTASQVNGDVSLIYNADGAGLQKDYTSVDGFALDIISSNVGFDIPTEIEVKLIDNNMVEATDVISLPENVTDEQLITLFSDFDVLPPSFNFNVVNEIQLNFSGGRDYDITIDDIKSLTKLFEIEGRAGVRGPGDYEFAIGLSGASADNTGTIDVEWTDGQPVNWSLEWIEGTGTANFTIGSETISFINNDQIDQVFNLFLINATAVTDSKVEAGSSIEFEIDNINGSPLATPYNISATSPSSGRDFQEFVTDVFVPPITNMSGTATISWPGSLDPTIDGRSRLAFKMKAYDPPVVSEPTDVTSVPEPSLIWGLMVLGIFPMIKGKK